MFDPCFIKAVLVLPQAALDLPREAPGQDITVAPSVKKIVLKLEKTSERAHSGAGWPSEGVLENQDLSLGPSWGDVRPSHTGNPLAFNHG